MSFINPAIKTKKYSKDQWNKNAVEYGAKEVSSNKDQWNKNAMNYKK